MYITLANGFRGRIKKGEEVEAEYIGGGLWFITNGKKNDYLLAEDLKEVKNERN